MGPFGRKGCAPFLTGKHLSGMKLRVLNNWSWPWCSVRVVPASTVLSGDYEHKRERAAAGCCEKTLSVWKSSSCEAVTAFPPWTSPVVEDWHRKHHGLHTDTPKIYLTVNTSCLFPRRCQNSPEPAADVRALSSPVLRDGVNHHVHSRELTEVFFLGHLDTF